MASQPYLKQSLAPPSPAAPMLSPEATTQNISLGQAEPAMSLPTPPITPIKLALAAVSRVASIDLERDIVLPSEPRPFVGSLHADALFGEGQWARVFRAQDEGLDQMCAVKVPRQSKSGEPVRVLRHEARILTLLASRRGFAEHVVAFHGLEPTSEALVLEYAPTTLQSLVKTYAAGSPLATDPLVGTRSFLSLVQSLVTSLNWIHAQGVIHGDIKPRNILAWSLDTVKVKFGDFSSSRLSCDSDPRPGDTCTTAYAAPELLRSFRSTRSSGSGVPTLQSDVWGLAATLLFAGTGEEPYSSIPHSLGRLAEATRGTAWEHMRNGRNIGRVREGGMLSRVLGGILTREESVRWTALEWKGVVDALDIDLGSNG